MKNRVHKLPDDMSMPEILKEVKQTVSVFLNERGIHGLHGTPYLRDNEYLACSRIIDDTNPHYLFAEVRYYKTDSKMPRYSWLSIPHTYVKYMVSDQPFHENRPLLEIAKVRKE